MKDLLINLVILIGSSALFFLLGEGLLRTLNPGGEYEFYVWPPFTHQEFAVPAGRLPGVSPQSLFSINSDGIRGRSFSDEDEYRILAIGGSTTECLYLDDKETWTSLLEERLNSQSDTRYWVGGVGKSGRATPDHILDVQKLLPQYPAIDLAVVLTGVNDFHIRLMYGEQFAPSVNMDLDYLRGKQLQKAFVSRPTQGFELIGLFSRALRALGSGSDASRHQVVQDPTGKIFVELREKRKQSPHYIDLPDLQLALQDYEANLNLLADMAARQEVRLLLLTQPSMWRTSLGEQERSLLWMGGVGDFFSSESDSYYSVAALARGMALFNDVTRKVCKERSLECLDLEKEISKDMHSFYDDVHFNVEGAQKVSRVVSNYLIRSPKGIPPVERKSDERFSTVVAFNKAKAWGISQPESRPLEKSVWITFEASPSQNTFVMINNKVLESTRGEKVITATIPSDLVKEEGNTLALVNMKSRTRQAVGVF